ncbi:ParB N-terminal domain-containing protein [Gemmata sp.]|uniref:ParB N-terminal domain-containing protein n=1 Tax=Gemmata sp. TaxID=1914242 RepID=UPI003F6EA018
MAHERTPVKLVPQFVRIGDVRIGDRVRKDLGDLAALAESMRTGLLQPIGLGPDMELIFGERRLRAAERLGWTDIPALIFLNLDDAVSQARAERDENHCRKQFEPTELVEAGRRLEALERPAAAARQRDLGRSHGPPSGNLPEGGSKKGDVRDKVGDALGVSGKKYEMGKRVVEAAEADPDRFGDLPAKMDETSVAAAYQLLKERQADHCDGDDEPDTELEHVAEPTPIAGREPSGPVRNRPSRRPKHNTFDPTPADLAEIRDDAKRLLGRLCRAATERRPFRLALERRGVSLNIDDLTGMDRTGDSHQTNRVLDVDALTAIIAAVADVAGGRP